VALLPLVTHRETIAFLFGDNPETGSDLPRLDALEVFIRQGGDRARERLPPEEA